jgi:predicted  nucleic acid-binding Zn-ribbon protein
MTDDEMKKKMEFIVEQQAQTVVTVQMLGERQLEAEKRISNLEGAFVGLVKTVDDTNTRIANVVERLEAANEWLKAALAETNERLNAFITVVERFLSEGRNGQTQN